MRPLPPSWRRAVHCPLAAFLLALIPAAPAAAAPLISEFLADNDAGSADEDGSHSDWIEIHNPDAAPLDLTGWYLTDNASLLTRWRFPATTIPPGGFLIVWASGKDRRAAGSPLHTNFSLGAEGEYLALVRPDGTTRQHEFAPAFPAQDRDRSFGTNFDGTPLLRDGAPLSWHVPANDTAGTAWTATDFTPGAGWTAGFSGAGYGILVPGVTVREVRKTGAPLSNLAETDALLALSPGSAGHAGERTIIAPAVNFLHDGGEGHYGNNQVFPNGGGDYFAVKATGFIQIPPGQSGAWTFGINSDDGGRIRIDGTDVMVDNTNHGPTDNLGSRGLIEGLHPFEVVYWEQGGGAHLEFFAARGTLTAWDSTFKLVGDTAGGGPAAFTSPASGGGAGGFVRTDLRTPMHGVNPGAYLRLPFTVTDTAPFASLQLSMRYNDGFVAYLNGTEVARRNAPDTLTWNAAATASRSTETSLVPETVNLTPFLSSLRQGNNVLAIHGLNQEVSDGSFFQLPEVTAGAPPGATAPVYFNTPTPGALNGQPSSFGKVENLAFSVQRGFHQAPFQLEISTATPETTIRYTTNGEAPTASTGTVYAGPLTISKSAIIRAAAFRPGWDPATSVTHSYLFLTDVIQQSPSGSAPPGWPSGSVNGQVYNYGMDPAIVNSTNTAIGGPDQVMAALMAIPSFSIVTAQADMTSAATGIYSNPGGRGFAWERPCSFELLNDPDNGGGFQINAGVRMRGGYSRQAENPKHSFHIFFRGDYGATKLRYPLHGGAGTDEFDTIDLRTSQNYSWSLHGDGANNTFLREEFTRLTQGDMGQPYSRSRYFHVYLNGQYWGLFNTDERPEGGHGEAYFGGSKDDYDVVKSAGNGGSYNTELTNGTITAWQNLWNQAMAMRTDPSNLRYYRMQGLATDGVTPLNDPAFPPVLDVNNQIDYMLLVFYAGSSDAPLTGGGDAVNNWFAYRRRDSNMGFLHFAHDMEHSCFGGDRTGPFVNAAVTNFNYANPQYLHQHMTGNAEYRMRWADRVHKHLFNDGALTTAKNLARVNALAQTVSSAIIAESARWGDAKVEPPRTKLDWEGAKNSLINGFITNRNAELLNQLRADNLYPNLAAPSLNKWGGYLAVTEQLLLSAPAGKIYYTTDGSDPRLTGGALNPAAKIFVSATTTDTFFPMGSSTVLVPWKYLVTNVDQGTAWRGTPGFAETGWLTGNTEMGFNDGDEVTTIEDNGTPGVQPSGSDRYMTTYFRKTFTVANPSQYTSFSLELKRDDGAVIYLNGEEIARPNMPPAPAVIAWNTPASSVAENNQDTIPIPASALQAGTNIIAIEIHQSSAGSSDLSFNCSLTGSKTNTAEPLFLTTPGLASLKARALDGTTWSALTDTTFFVNTVAADTNNLAVTEIMYHPADPTLAEFDAGFTDAGDFEFIELMNFSTTHSVDLAGVQFSLGVTFDFDHALTGRIVPPGGRILLVKNRAAFEFRYGTGLPVAGEFSGSLDNSGESLQMLAAAGHVLTDFAFADTAPWPKEADGSGRSLVRRQPGVDAFLIENWRASLGSTGNPGASDAISYAAWKTANAVTTDSADTDRDGLTAFSEYAAGGSLTGSSQHQWLSAGVEAFTVAGQPEPVTFQTITVTRRSGADDVDFIAESSTGLDTWAADLRFVRSSMNPDGTETLTWRSDRPWTGHDREMLRLRFVLLP